MGKGEKMMLFLTTLIISICYNINKILGNLRLSGYEPDALLS